MPSWPVRSVVKLLLLLPAYAGADDSDPVALTKEEEAIVGVGTADVPIGYVNVKDPWIDRVHNTTFNSLWRSAMTVDHWFGGSGNEPAYMETRGSISPALLWDEFDGFQPRLRFAVDMPLPVLSERFHAFIGRVNPDEYVTERAPNSGAFARQYGPTQDDETLLGVRYRVPKQGSSFEADAGLKLTTPLDPFVKGSYNFMHGTSETTLIAFRETVFWQNTEKFGFTSRIDIERTFGDAWLARWTGSATISERTEGVRGYSSITMMRGLPRRRAVAAELFTQAELDADVPLGNYGVKFAYRQSVAREWLVLETRLSLTFPKDYPWEDRQASWGVGVGLEMFFGTSEFLARPVTF